MDLANATVRIVRAVRLETGTGGLDREVRYDPMPEQRASLRQMSPGQALALLGQVALNTWSLRLHAKAEIGPGTVVKAKRDGQQDWSEYRVLTVRRGMYVRAILEAVEG